jgi:exonuclease SbcD
MIHAPPVPFRLLHTSDWHLGRSLHALGLLPDQEVFLAFLLELLASDPHDALIVAGDVFDRAVPSEDAVASLSRFLSALRARCPELPIILIAGNHDSATRLAFGSELLASMQLHLRGGVSALDSPIRLTGRDGTPVEIWPRSS